MTPPIEKDKERFYTLDDEAREEEDLHRELYEDYSDKRSDLTITDEDLAMLEGVGQDHLEIEHSGSTTRLRLDPNDSARRTSPHAHAKVESAELEISLSEDELAELEGALADDSAEEEDEQETGVIRHDPLD
jgi:hypothetical protein